MTKPDLSEHELDALFSTARQNVPTPDDDFLARLSADAEAFAQNATAPAQSEVVPGSLWSQIRTVFGGWGGMGGLVAATVAGIWIGIAPPADMLDPASFVSTGLEEAGAFDDLLSFSETSLFALEDG